MTKQEARDEMRRRRDVLSEEERKKLDGRVREHLLSLGEVQGARALFSFVSHGTEVDTKSLIAMFLERGRMVAVPRVSGREMDFYQITCLSQLKPGYRGILEPEGGRRVEAREGVMLLPGLAFDGERHRVGYGGGYYDRYLASCSGKKLVTAAVAYDFQVVDSLSVEAHDWRPDILVTDRRIVRGEGSTNTSGSYK